MTLQNPAHTANVSAPASQQPARRTRPYRSFTGDIHALAAQVTRENRGALDILTAYDRDTKGTAVQRDKQG